MHDHENNTGNCYTKCENIMLITKYNNKTAKCTVACFSQSQIDLIHLVFKFYKYMTG